MVESIHVNLYICNSPYVKRPEGSRESGLVFSPKPSGRYVVISEIRVKYKRGSRVVRVVAAIWGVK